MILRVPVMSQLYSSVATKEDFLGHGSPVAVASVHTPIKKLNKELSDSKNDSVAGPKPSTPVSTISIPAPNN